ncbi:hypothetical protein [Aneurinibacillus migulanus]|nr:hypothetical protein [Aneurinibacillus migulanus]MED0896343.1 hypothetical protein [Aneurinibacillus migulanus]MED1618615.1 hypothetical protein [Aneurinibacillus migulanus]MED4729672.1 hypothetical protein [Aneurinibacillus migulanus]GED18125.1 hypothetical protein AMI01nite_61160 [Aneurinibacillus migulanus]
MEKLSISVVEKHFVSQVEVGERGENGYCWGSVEMRVKLYYKHE